MKRYQDQFSPRDIKGIVESYRYSYENLVEDFEDMGFDELLSDYIKERYACSIGPRRVIQAMWNTVDKKICVRLIKGTGISENDDIRFATPEEMKVIDTTNTTNIYLDLADFEEYYRSHGFTGIKPLF